MVEGGHVAPIDLPVLQKATEMLWHGLSTVPEEGMVPSHTWMDLDVRALSV